VITSDPVAGIPMPVSLVANAPREPPGSFVRNNTRTPSARTAAIAWAAPSMGSPPRQTTPSRSTISPSNPGRTPWTPLWSPAGSSAPGRSVVRGEPTGPGDARAQERVVSRLERHRPDRQLAGPDGQGQVLLLVLRR